MGRRQWASFFGLYLLGCSAGGGPHGAPMGPQVDKDPASSTPDAALGPKADARDASPPAMPGPDFGPGPWDTGWPIPAEPQSMGDAEVGKKRLFEGAYMSCGVPYSLLSLMGVDAFTGLFGGAGAGETIEREGKAKDLPYMMSVFTASNGAEVAMANCLMCHGGHFNGKLVVGLGAADFDFTAGPGGPLEGIGGIPGDTLANLLLFLTPAEREHLSKLVSRAGVTAGIKMRTVGNNPAEMQAVLLVAHHDPQTLAWSDELLMPAKVVDHDGKEIENPIVTSDPPPWWRAHKKHALFYNGMARGDHRGTMALASTMCVDTVEEAQYVDDIMRDVQAYVETLRPPAYPFAIDQALAQAGKGVFIASCAGCHGTYEQDEDREWYPNLLIPLEEIATDPVVAEAGVIHSPHMVKWYNQSFYGGVTRMEVNNPFPGYMAPPLDGIWATGPFLHNGSVPNIELVLNSRARPNTWRRVDLDSTHFDQATLGFPFEATSYGQTDAPLGAQTNMIYDTSYWSQSNEGHTYGDALTVEQRRAVLEYLKTL